MLFTDEHIIGISLIDTSIDVSNKTVINVGNVQTAISGSIANNFYELDCGTISLDEYYGSFADYEPFIATTLYLPKVGFVQIPADCCVNNTIQIVFKEPWKYDIANFNVDFYLIKKAE